MRQKLLTISGFILLIGFAVQGIFGIAASLFICGLAGSILGLYKKEKSIWKPSMIILIAAIISITVFIVLLNNSNM